MNNIVKKFYIRYFIYMFKMDKIIINIFNY